MASLDWTPADCPQTVTYGDNTQEVTFAIEDVNGDPIAVTSVVAQVRQRRDRSSALIMDLEPTSSGNVVTLPGGIEIDGDPGSYWWDMQVNDLTHVSGSYRILRDVSVEGGS